LGSLRMAFLFSLEAGTARIPRRRAGPAGRRKLLRHADTAPGPRACRHDPRCQGPRDLIKFPHPRIATEAGKHFLQQDEIGPTDYARHVPHVLGARVFGSGSPVATQRPIVFHCYRENCRQIWRAELADAAATNAWCGSFAICPYTLWKFPGEFTNNSLLSATTCAWPGHCHLQFSWAKSNERRDEAKMTDI
jgi:hypothetical protein